jgi:predicted SAM-dependent methyltransferase
MTECVKQTLGDGEVREERKLHIGCATITPSGWINLDGSWNARLAKYPFLRRVLGFFCLIPSDKLTIQWSKDVLVHDVRKGLPFEDNFLTVVYASHLLEHLYLEEAKSLLRECLRTLKPGGVIRLVVPDLYSIVLKYMNELQLELRSRDNGKLSPADKLCQRLGMRPQVPPRGNLFYRFYATVKDFHSHKWMYDKESLMRHLLEAGFVDVSEKMFLESKIGGIEEVERKDRFDNAGICVEGVKPLEISFPH